ncbi:hypothetical protein FRC09_001119 [Ceratobasidium sp. 395]|nr:hypothetical protein FRC09_001119 [Ceratobasidium sp. 395]
MPSKIKREFKLGVSRVKQLLRGSSKRSVSSTRHENTTNLPTTSILPAPEQKSKLDCWAELGTLVELLNKASTSVGPLKDALRGILAGIETFEVAAENREDYQNLRRDLSALFHDLAEFLGASTPPVMTSSIANLARGIERELDAIRGKQWESRLGTYLNASKDADEILVHYRRIQALLQRITMNIDLKTLRIVDEQATENRLKALPNSEAAKYNSAESYSLRNGCTKDTRLEVLEDLYEWARDDKSQKIYWLNGMAGTGKTTIAYSLCERLKDSESLAASFFCSRQLPACRNINRIVPTISYQLSRFSRPFRSAISQVLEKDLDAHNHPLHDQFEKLIAETLVHVRKEYKLAAASCSRLQLPKLHQPVKIFGVGCD